jgi:hypothetical protein
VLDLDFGKCSLQVQVPSKGDLAKPEDLIGKNVVTSFTNLAERYFRQLETEQSGATNGDAKDAKLKTNIKYVGGSVEAACALGVADGIVDLVESGETMRAAGLKAISTVVSSSAILIKSKHPSDPKLVDLITARIKGVISTFPLPALLTTQHCFFLLIRHGLDTDLSSRTKVRSLHVQHRALEARHRQADNAGQPRPDCHFAGGERLGRHFGYGAAQADRCGHGQAHRGGRLRYPGYQDREFENPRLDVATNVAILWQIELDGENRNAYMRYNLIYDLLHGRVQLLVQRKNISILAIEFDFGSSLWT